MRLMQTPVIILVINFLHNFAFNAGTFYLALYYQVSHHVPVSSVQSYDSTQLGRQWVESFGSGYQTFALFPWFVLGIYASCLAHRALATTEP